MTNNIFLEWMQHLKKNTQGGLPKDNRHLLILDGHSSNVTIETISNKLKIGLDIITLPTHSSQILQYLNVSCFYPFKYYLTTQRIERMRLNPYSTIGPIFNNILIEI